MYAQRNKITFLLLAFLPLSLAKAEELWTCGEGVFTNRPVNSSAQSCNKFKQANGQFNKLSPEKFHALSSSRARLKPFGERPTVSFNYRPIRRKESAKAYECLIWGSIEAKASSSLQLSISRGESKINEFELKSNRQGSKLTWKYRLSGPCMLPQVEARYK